jgi:hypothetical protein
MTFKIISAALLATSMMAGSAMAQATGVGTDGNPNRDQAASAGIWENRDTMGGFYTDDTWATVRTPEEIRAYWDTMSPEDQAMMTDECANLIETENPNQEDAQSLTRQQICEQITM